MASSVLSALNSMSSTLPRKCITSAVIFASGDALSQHAFERRAWSAHDYSRSARIAVHGGVVFAPIMHNWFRLIRRITLPNKAAQAVARVAADQLIGGPFFPAIFFTSLTLLEGGSLQQVHDRLKKSWFRTWCIGVLVFTPASAINMTLIPPQNSVLFVSLVSLNWNAYLSYTHNRHKELIDDRQAIQEAAANE